MMTQTELIAPYQPTPWQHRGLLDKSPVCLFTGSAGGGKSRCAAEKVHAYMMKYPGATGLLVRKAREFANKSMVMMMHRVIGNDPRVTFLKGDKTFVYQNGSMLFVGGMKDDSQRESIRSIGQDGALDFVWMEEANAFTFDDFQELRARMRGRSASWRQILLTTNPDAPNHWINQDLIIGGRGSVYYSGAADNPHNPPEYIASLESLTGTLYDRLVRGRWTQAQGVVYDNFSPEWNVTEDAAFIPGADVYWGVDNGHAHGDGPGTMGYHPRVILVAQQVSGGVVHIVDEYYATLELPEVTIRRVLEDYPLPRFALVDSSAAELRRRLSMLRIRNSGGTHKVSDGIQVVRRFIRDGHGVVNLKIHPRCKNLILELQSYRYDDRGAADGGERKPVKMDDHGADALRYLLYAWR